jgi:hypothetical protein
MATTKGDLARRALSKLSVTGWDYEIDPEELKSACVSLEDMMAQWDANGIKVGYSFAEFPDAVEVSSPANVPDIAYKAIVYALAIEIADSYGKQVTAAIQAGASSGMSSLLSAIAYVPRSTYGNNMPRGSGNTQRNNQWDRFYRRSNTIDADNAGPIDTNGQGVLQP